MTPSAAAGDLTDVQHERYARHLSLPGFGVQGQRHLTDARVLVVGAGGLGSPCLLYLAAAGVGRIGVIDDDLVDASNLQRQVLHTEAEVGRSKAASAARAIGALNSAITVTQHPVRLTAETALDVIAGYDLVCDGSDNFETRYLVSDACAVLGLPCVFGSVYQYEAQCSVFWAGRGPQYRDLYPSAPPPELAPDCGQGGVLGALCGLTGSIMAMEAIKALAGIGDSLLGRMLVIDAWTMTVREVPIAVRTPAPQSLQDSDPTSGTTSAALTPAELAELLLHDARAGRVELVDVREPHETRSGVIPGARCVPLTQVLRGEWTMTGDRVVFYCQAGGRSARALTAAAEQGLDAAVHLAGGADAWRRAGLDLVHPDPA